MTDSARGLGRIDGWAVLAAIVLISVAGGLYVVTGKLHGELANVVRWTVRAQGSSVKAYEIYRGEASSEAYRRIGTITASSSEAPTASYQFEDESIRGDTRYRYYLVALAGNDTRHRLPGEVEATAKFTSLRASLDQLAALLIATALYLAALSGALGRWRAVGDESDYLRRASAADPHAPRFYLRVPLFVSLVRVASAHGALEARARLLSWTGAIATTGIVGLSALSQNIPLAFVALGLVLCLEFFVFALRLWPEPLLAALHALLVWFLILAEPSGEVSLAVGLIGALAVALRLEQLVLGPAALFAWWWSGSALTLIDIALVLAPSWLFLVAWGLRNGRRYGSYWPDTTWRFNAALTLQEASERSPDGVIHIESTIRDTVVQLKREGRFATVRLSPLLIGRVIVGALRRVIAFIGKDTFVRYRLLPPAGRGFEETRGRGFFDVSLRWGFPLLVATAFLSAWFAENWPAYLAPSAALFAACTLFHSRTRYRQVLVPTLVFWLADSLDRINPGFTSGAWLLIAGAAVVLGLLTLREED